MKNILIKIIFTAFILLSVNTFAQNSVGIGTTTPNAKSILDLTSTTQGLLPPRMTTAQRTGIAPGASEFGLVVYDTDLAEFYFWDGAGWKTMGGADSDWLTNGTHIYNGNSGYIGIGTTSPSSPLNIHTEIAPTLGQLSIQGTAGDVSNQAYMSFLNENGERLGFFGDATIAGDNILIISKENLNIGAGDTGGDLFIQSDGNVGVGTVTPNYKFQVNSSNNGPDIYLEGTGTYTSIDINAKSGTNSLVRFSEGGTVQGTVMYTPSTGTLRFARYIANQQQGIHLDASSNVGIGLSNPSSELDVVGDVEFSGALKPGNLSGTSGQVLTSNGAGTAPSWTTPPTADGNGIYGGSGSLIGLTTVNYNGNELRLTQGTGYTTVNMTTTGGSWYFRTNGSTTSTFMNNGDVDLGQGTAYFDYTNKRVGIGTTTPSRELEIANNGRLRIGSAANQNVEIYQTGTRTRIFAENFLEIGANGGGIGMDMDDGDFSTYLTTHVNGKFQVNDGTQAAGRLFVSDATGYGSWQDAASASANIYSVDGTLTGLRTVLFGANDMIFNLNSTGDFHVQDAGVSKLYINDVGNTFYGGDQYWRDINAVSGTDIMTLIDDGNDGRLRIYENGIASVDIDANTQFVFNEQGLDRNFRVESTTNSNMLFVDAGTDRVGIGTGAPIAKLQVQGVEADITGVTGVFLNIGNNATGTDGTMTGLRFNNYNGTTATKGAIFYQRNQGFGIGDMHFAINSAFDATDVTKANTIMTIRSTGDIGIGTIAPDYKLSVVDASPNIELQSLATNAVNSGTIIFSEGTIESAYVNYDGSTNLFHIGTSSVPTALSMPRANGYIGLGLTPGYQLQLSLNSAAKPGTNTWTVASDARLKKDVKTYEGGLNDLMKINPVWFTYTGEAGMPQETYVGIIAQDLQKVAPYMVSEWQYHPDGEIVNENESNIKPENTYLGVDNGAMTYMLINATKEQQTQIETLKTENSDLKKQLDAQQTQIDELRKLIENK